MLTAFGYIRYIDFFWGKWMLDCLRADCSGAEVDVAKSVVAHRNLAA